MRQASALLLAASLASHGAWLSAGPDQASETRPCLPVEGGLAAGATLAGAAGTYQLVLTGRRTRGKLRTVSGALVLVPSVFDPAAFKPALAPLRGAADIDLRAVGAFPAGDVGSKDPAAPGVLVLESRQGDAPRILLRLGADANRPESPLFDGSHAVLEVRRIAASGFAGTWRSAADGLAASGHFCAWRSGDAPAVLTKGRGDAWGP